MLYQILADMVVVLHLVFVVFAVGGGLLLHRWRRVVWAHAPAVLWAAVVEVSGWLCPLTPLENWLRMRGGEAGYAGDFVGHYILSVVYPAQLTRRLQVILGCLVVAANLWIYWRIFFRIEKA